VRRNPAKETRPWSLSLIQAGDPSGRPLPAAHPAHLFFQWRAIHTRRLLEV